MKSDLTEIVQGSKKRILLIEPPFYVFFGYGRWYYPVTLTLVGTYLEELGHEVMVYDADKPSEDCKSLSRIEAVGSYHLYEEAIEDDEHPVWSEVRKTIEDFRPDIVGLTSVSAKIDSADMVARITKGLYGNKVETILGGAHAAGVRAMRPDYDFGFNYDYIITHIPYLLRRKPNKNLLMGLDKYPPVDLSCLLTSTGCPNNCTFCYNSYDRSFVYRDMDSIRKEVEEIKDCSCGGTPIDIMDDCLFSNETHFEGVSKIIKDSGSVFTTGSRIIALSPQKIEYFIECGGRYVYVGVESGSQRILDLIRKRLSVEDIIERTKWLNDFRLQWAASFMVGFPFETLEDLKLTEELIHTIQPSFVAINRFVPYPGTEIYKEYFINNQIRFRDLFQLNRHSCIRLTDEIEDYIDHMFKVADKYNSERPYGAKRVNV